MYTDDSTILDVTLYLFRVVEVWEWRAGVRIIRDVCGNGEVLDGIERQIINTESKHRGGALSMILL